MIIELIALILLAAEALILITTIILTLIDVIDWFTSKEEVYFEDTDNIAFTLKQDIANGEYTTVQGIFNKRTGKVVDGQKIKSQSYDEELLEKHSKHRLVVWQ